MLTTEDVRPRKRSAGSLWQRGQLRWLPQGLERQLMLLTAACLVAAILGYGAYTAKAQSDVARQTVSAQMSALAQNLATIHAHLLIDGDHAMIEAITIQTATVPGIFSVLITDVAGKPISEVVNQNGRWSPRFGTQPVAVPAQGLAVTLFEAYDARAAQRDFLSGKAGKMFAWHPIAASSALGWVRVSYRLDDLEKTERNIWAQALQVIALAIATTLLLLARLLRAPMSALRAATRFAADLDHTLGAQVEVFRGSTEISALGDALNVVSARLFAQSHDLVNQKFALDQHAIVSVTDLAGTITYANQLFCDISGYTQNELVGQNHRINKSGFHGSEFFSELWHTISQGQVWRGEIKNRRKDGSHYWVSATIVPLLGTDGLPQQYIGIRTDITARKTIESELTEQLCFVEVLLDAMPTAIYLKDTAGRYLRFNRAFEELFGIQRTDWIGKTVFDLVPGEAATMMDAKDQELFRTGTLQSYEANFTNRRSGMTREGLYSKALLANHKGEPTALIGTILDITERNAMVRDIHEARRSAEAANQAKSEFLANMSHEIRTPMNGVIGMTELALDTELNATQRSYLNTVQSSAQSLLVILNGILDFSKIEAGKLDIERIDFDLPLVVTDALQSIEVRTAKKGLTLLCELRPDLPTRVIGDAGRLRQVLTNLCDNAIKFTQEGGLTVRVRCSGHTPNDYEVEISVRDTGTGIAPDNQQLIFSAFSQADASTTRQFGGTGLGLTISTRLVELMGGRIWLDSALGQGSTFYFTLRLGRPGKTLAPAVAPPSMHAVNNPVAQPVAASERILRVLLVEDHPVNQLLATTLLKKWGHLVAVAQNGREAVDLFATATWDIILMDMQMPVMDGLEATTLIRAMEASPQHTPIIAITANAMHTDREACQQSGMDDHLAKPISAPELHALLMRYCPPIDRDI